MTGYDTSSAKTKFLVRVPGCPTYLIYEYQLTNQSLTVTRWVLSTEKLMDCIKAADVTDPIEIHILTPNGDVDEILTFANYKLTNWCVSNTWANNNPPLEIKFTYELI